MPCLNQCNCYYQTCLVYIINYNDISVCSTYLASQLYDQMKCRMIVTNALQIWPSKKRLCLFSDRSYCRYKQVKTMKLGHMYVLYQSNNTLQLLSYMAVQTYVSTIHIRYIQQNHMCSYCVANNYRAIFNCIKMKTFQHLK